MNKADRAVATRTFWLRLAGTLLTAGLLVWLLLEQGLDNIVRALLMIPAWQLAAGLLLTLLSRLAVTMRWHVLLRASGEQVSARQTLRLTFAGLFASNYLPTTIGGDVVRLAGAVQLNLDGPRSAASLVLDRLVGMAGMACVLPWGLGSFLQSGMQIFTFTSGVSAQVGVSAAPGRWGRLSSVLKRLLNRFWQALLTGARHPRALLTAFGFTLIHMVCTFSTIWLVLQGMGQSVPWLLVGGIWSMVYFVTLLPVSINGYGLQEVSVTLLYAHLGHITPEASIAVAFITRTLTMLASLPGALFVPGIISFSRQGTPAGVGVRK